MKRATSILLLAAALLLNAFAAQAAEPRSFVRGSFKEIAAARQGQPYILAFWSLTCTHCREELGLLGNLLARHPGLRVVLVSTDTPEEAPAIAATLADYRLERAESWVFADSFTERLRADVDKKWRGELPRTYLCDRAHACTATSGKLNPRRIDEWMRADE